MAASKPTFPLSKISDYLRNTKQLFWDLNHGLGCFPLGYQNYSGILTLVRAIMNSEFDKVAEDFSSWLSNQCSTPLSTKDKAVLRYISGGTRYHQIRLAFHP